MDFNGARFGDGSRGAPGQGWARLSSTLLAACSLAAVAGCADRREEPVSAVHAALASGTCVNLHRGGAASVADAYVKANALDRNFGASPILRISAKEEALLRFDLASIPANAAVTRATLRLYVSGENGDGNTEMHRVLAPWDEAKVTFRNFGQAFSAATSAAFRLDSPTALKSVDLTALVAGWVAGAYPNNGVLMRPATNHHPRWQREEDDDSDPSVLVSSDAANGSKRPALEVCYTLVTDQCQPNPCLNGGACLNGQSGFTCQCPAGFTGAICETNVDDCSSSPCQNGGTCIDEIAGFTCGCPAGFTGVTCEINIDDCAPNPCLNGGVCTDGVASFRCQCAPGYDGDRCDHVIDNCDAGPCHNGGSCVNNPAGFTCSCAVGFAGPTCDTNIDDCVGNGCQNGSSCIDGIAGYSCSCAPDWGGTRCEVNLDTCAQNPCLNGSSCVNGFGTYQCTCAPGYAGTNCEIDIDDCAATPCANGGVCVDGVDAFTCVCTPGFTGATCQDVDTTALCGQAVCGAGQTCCGSSACADLATDRNNCGACGQSCALWQRCVAGACVRDRSFCAATDQAVLTANAANLPGANAMTYYYDQITHSCPALVALALSGPSSGSAGEVRLMPPSGSISSYLLPNMAVANGIAATPDGRLWSANLLLDPDVAYLVRADPGSSMFNPVIEVANTVLPLPLFPVRAYDVGFTNRPAFNLKAYAQNGSFVVYEGNAGSAGTVTRVESRPTGPVQSTICISCSLGVGSPAPIEALEYGVRPNGDGVIIAAIGTVLVAHCDRVETNEGIACHDPPIAVDLSDSRVYPNLDPGGSPYPALTNIFSIAVDRQNATIYAEIGRPGETQIVAIEDAAFNFVQPQPSFVHNLHDWDVAQRLNPGSLAAIYFDGGGRLAIADNGTLTRLAVPPVGGSARFYSGPIP